MEIEWLIVADAAQVVGNKLYMMGGGWDRLTVRSGFPVNQHMGIALAFKIPWSETNERHSFEIEVATDDCQTLQKINGELEVGRPPGVPAGSDQRAQIAATANVEFKQPGQYTIIARLDGEDIKSIVFNVTDGNQVSGRGTAPTAPPAT